MRSLLSRSAEAPIAHFFSLLRQVFFFHPRNPGSSLGHNKKGNEAQAKTGNPGIREDERRVSWHLRLSCERVLRHRPSRSLTWWAFRAPIACQETKETIRWPVLKDPTLCWWPSIRSFPSLAVEKKKANYGPLFEEPFAFFQPPVISWASWLPS